MSIPFPSPLDQLDDKALFDTLLVLDLSCGRAKSVLRDKHRGRLCTLATILRNESADRGTSTPQPPYKA